MTDKENKLKIVGGAPKSHDEELRQWLDDFIKTNSHLTTDVLSRSQHIGVSRTALDAYLDRTYFLEKESGGQGVDPKRSNIEQRIRSYRDKVEGTVRHGYASRFLETRTYKQVVQACATAISENVIVVVYGKPGIGKTQALGEFAIRKMQTMPIQILVMRNVTPRYFVQKIAGELGIDDRPSIPHLEDLIAQKLKRSPRPLFIDQGNYLNERSLGTVCHIWEIARIPIVLAGTKDLYDLFMSSRLTEDVRAQLSSRVAMHYPLSDLTKAECVEIITRALGADASDENVAAVLNVTAGNHRHLDFIFPRINELKNRNKQALESGEISMEKIILTAGHKIMAG